MLRGLRTKMVLIMVLLILSLMTVIGAFLVNSVMGYYLTDFYTQMNEVFQSESLASDLRTPAPGEEDGAQSVLRILEAYSGALGINQNRGRTCYILSGETGEPLATTGTLSDTALAFTPNMGHALTKNEVASGSSIASSYMDLAIPFQRGEQKFVIYIIDDKTAVRELTSEILMLVFEALFFGLIISVLLSFLLSKTMAAPLQRLTEGVRLVAQGDFSQEIEVSSRDEIGVLTDAFNHMATKLKDSIRQVENERNKLGTLFLHMTDGVVAFSRTGAVIHANPSAESMLHQPIGADVTYRALFEPIAPLSAVLDTEDHLQAEMTAHDRIFQVLLAPFDRHSDDGGILVVLHDVTEQRHSEQNHRDFVANVSHELRTPLTNIHSYAETLAENDDIEPAISQKFLRVILNESERMTNLVQDLLTLSRLDSGRSDLKMESFSFSKSITDVYQGVLMDAHRHGHTLSLLMDESLPEIIGDRTRIEQVIVNIVANAIKYTPDGGEIIISAGQKDKFVWLCVDDNGIGIPQQDRQRIFDRFYRVDKARARQSGGTGLGLSIAKELVDRHEGKLFLVDKTEKGLCVQLELKIEGPQNG